MKAIAFLFSFTVVSAPPQSRQSRRGDKNFMKKEIPVSNQYSDTHLNHEPAEEVIFGTHCASQKVMVPKMNLTESSYFD